ncbi:uncharacterized protein [Rutidosis leptorrhynchoides]|uniref:uncharacterized protein isoform X2 n=1 Tax=Rutidosis leptorrhynchoides TaxID=125765 RepID=UPI003A9A4A59
MVLDQLNKGMSIRSILCIVHDEDARFKLIWDRLNKGMSIRNILWFTMKTMMLLLPSIVHETDAIPVVAAVAAPCVQDMSVNDVGELPSQVISNARNASSSPCIEFANCTYSFVIEVLLRFATSFFCSIVKLCLCNRCLLSGMVSIFHFRFLWF